MSNSKGFVRKSIIDALFMAAIAGAFYAGKSLGSPANFESASRVDAIAVLDEDCTAEPVEVDSTENNCLDANELSPDATCQIPYWGPASSPSESEHEFVTREACDQ